MQNTKLKVHILATCRNPELLPATTLVFKTLRTGFPTAHVTVWKNGDFPYKCSHLAHKIMEPVVDKIEYVRKTIHHKWIETLLKHEKEPFYICDTDMIFWDSVESWDHANAPMAGRYVPQFRDQFTKCITRPRLHTSLLWMNPQVIKARVDKWLNDQPETVFNPKANLLYPLVVPFLHLDRAMPFDRYFFDTTSLLYQVVGGMPFIKPWLDHYDHLNFGTISDIVAPHYPANRFREAHFAIFENPELARGMWKSQEKFYQEHAC